MHLYELKFRSVWLIVGLQVAFLAATGLPLPAEGSAVSQESAALLQDASPGQGRECVVATAVYYANRFNGKRTASGAIVNPRKLTAAHPTLPLGTRLEVKNLANDRSVVVTVNDRCRKRRFEYIDLSREAARRLGFLGKGKTRVQWREAD